MPEDNGTQPQSPLPLNPDLAGYQTPEALAAGYRASSAEAKRLRDENERKDALLAQLIQNGDAANQRTVPNRRATPMERLTDYGVPGDAITELVRSEIQGALAPISRGIQARGKVVAEHPEYIQFENDVANFIANDPALSQSYPLMFEADPVSAMEYAFLKFGDSRRRAPGSPEGGHREGSAEAAIPQSRSGDGRRGPDEGTAVREAFERFQKTGSSADAQTYARTRLGPILKEQFRRAGQEL